ncbi:hypothetical protein HDU96_010005 [Phlyctochytrium bullatum]|nr:hypothetical protein HDU96_010005 [Phlyctochytrium bullatum]
MVLAIGSIVVPVTIVFLEGSRRSVNTLTENTVQLLLRSAAAEVSTFLDDTADILESVTNSTYFARDFEAALTGKGIRASADLMPFLARMLNSKQYISGIICQNSGPMVMGPMGPYSDKTVLQVISLVTFPQNLRMMLSGRGITLPSFLQDYTGKVTVAIITEPSTSLFIKFAILDPVSYDIAMEFPIGPVGLENPNNDVGLRNMLSSTPSTTPYFDTTFINVTSLSSQFWQSSFYRNVWRNPANVGKTRPDFVCSVGSLVDSFITPLLDTIKPTEHTVLMLLDESNLMLSTNKNASVYVYDATKSGNAAMTRVLPDMSPNSEVANVGNGIVSLFGGYDSLPRKSPTVSSDIVVNQVNLADGKPWFISSAGFTVKRQKFTLVVAFPRSDIFATLDTAYRNAIIIASTVATAGVIFIAGMTILTLRPLHRLARAMKQLTKFDFSSLENGGLAQRSRFREIQDVESVFDEMVVAFAAAIRKNKMLLRRNLTTTSVTTRIQESREPSIYS